MKISRRVLVGSLLGLFSIVAVACGDDSSSSNTVSPDTPVIADLQGKSYDLVDATGIQIPEGSALKLDFLATNMTISGGCNTMTGGWGIEDGRLMTTEFAQTQKACDEALMTFDDQIIQIVGAQPTITLVDGKLTLVKDEVTLDFQEAAA